MYVDARKILLYNVGLSIYKKDHWYPTIGKKIKLMI